MKKFMALFLFLFASLGFLTSREFSIGFDCMSLDSFLMEDSRFDVELSFFNDDCSFIFPIRYGKDGNNRIKFCETGLLVDVYPVEGLDFFVEASFFKAGWLWGLYQPEDPFVLSTEGSLGWSFRWGHAFLKPKITIRNPYLTENEKTELVKSIDQFSDIRISLVGGCAF